VSGRTRAMTLILLGLMPALQAFSQAQTPRTSIRDCDLCPEMVVVTRGSYRMGLLGSMSSERLDIAGPPHEVTIAQDLAVSRFETTVGQFAAFVKEGGRAEEKGTGCTVLNGDMRWEVQPDRDWRHPGFVQTDEHPVVCINWHEAKAYAEWLAKKTGKGYRLLSEAEWEYVARAGVRGVRPWGEAESDACKHANVWDETGPRELGLLRSSDRGMIPGVTVGALGIQDGGSSGGSGLHGGLGPWYRVTHWCTDSYAYTAPVGTYLPNRFGVHDMIGNVWEWVEDCMNSSYTGAPSDGTAWQTGNCEQRVQRGASWASVPRDALVVQRLFRSAESRSFDSGFRVARPF